MRWIFIVVPLFVLLVWSLWYAGQAFTINGEPMPLAGYLAMAGGVFFSIVVGCGLMALTFYSSRKGYDDAAGEQPPSPDK